MYRLLLIAATSYLLGSIPFGFLLVRIFRGEDVRLSGSGNIGATNVSRKSPALGILTLLLDALKGSAAVYIAALIYQHRAPSGALAFAALCAVCGHLFPVWLKFRGGKGVATGLGSFLMIAPKAVLIAAAIFFVVVLIFRYISLGSILAVASFPPLAFFTQQYGSFTLSLLWISLASLLIIAKHHENIRRLLAGTESRFGSRPATQEEK
jgi:glycerol-3-phosphate acyltransferase PlsY